MVKLPKSNKCPGLTHSKIMNPENTLTRKQIQEKYIHWDLEQMSVDDLEEFFVNTQTMMLDDLNDVELVKEVKHFAPHIVENITLSV